MSDPSPVPASPPAASAETQSRAQLQAEPTHHASALALANLLFHDGRVDEAIALLGEHAVDRDCGDLLREYFIGERMNDEAQRLLAQRGTDASASGLVDNAIASHLRGDIEGALSYCRLAITADPAYAPAHNHQGRALFNARRAVPARAALVHAVRIAPNYAEAWHNLAHALRDANEFEQSERAYGHALRLRPAYRSARLNLGIVQIALRRLDDALENFRSLLAIDPTHAEGCFNLAVCEHLLRRYDDARTSYARALVLDPHNPRVSLQLGRLCNELHDVEGALQQFRRALDLNPHDPEAWSEIAMLHDQADHPEEVERAIAAGLAAAPGDASLRLEQANLARRRGDFDAALAGLRAIDPQALHPRLRPRYEKSLELTLARLG
jgi:tetratricopeptide (TPR) repeat protein